MLEAGRGSVEALIVSGDQQDISLAGVMMIVGVSGGIELRFS
jgi:hypothetical protein